MPRIAPGPGRLDACKLPDTKNERQKERWRCIMIRESVVKDLALAPEGHRKIAWVAQHSPVLNQISGDRLSDGSLRGRNVAMAIHLEAKTAYLALRLSEAG